MYLELDNREQGIYRNLLDECFSAGSITSDPALLARFVREPIDYFAQVWAKIRRKFRSVNNGERLINPRMNVDRKRLQTIRAERKKRASGAAKKRWAKSHEPSGLDATSIGQAMLGDAQTQIQIQKEGEGNGEVLSPPPLKSNTEDFVIPPTSSAGADSGPKYPFVFETFWAESTKRGSKLEACREWKKLNPTPELMTEIGLGMQAWKHSEQWQDETKQPHICRWLKRRGWEEIVPKSSRGNSNGQQQFETKAEALIRKQKESGQRARELLRGSTGDGAGATDTDGTDAVVRPRLVGSD